MIDESFKYEETPSYGYGTKANIYNIYVEGVGMIRQIKWSSGVQKKEPVYKSKWYIDFIRKQKEKIS